jgi:ArsR family transcriptional regulator
MEIGDARLTGDASRAIEAFSVGAANDKRLVKMFKALSHPNRMRLFTEIRQEGSRAFEEGHVCFLHDLMERLDVGAPTVSYHLKELVDADLITTDRQGKYVTCRVNAKALDAIRSFFGQL